MTAKEGVMRGKKVFLTGVHTGLGHALAHRCLARGAEVWGLSRSEPQDLAGRDGWSFRVLDLRWFDEIRLGLQELLDGAGALDLVVFNAGVLGPVRDLAETSLDELREVMDINVWANKELLDGLYALEHTPAQVVGISSGAARNGSGGWGAYSISKAALNLMLRVYANERPQTHFTAVAPGIVDTSMTRWLRDEGSDDARHPATSRVRKAFEENRVATPEQAADRLLDLLSAFREHDSGAFLDVREL
jgi:NAD(P)-dependent dehydrogenase (short-subunit alcohol dehydrogenase family)